MSITIDQSFVEQFSTNVHMLAEQRMSRLMNAVRREDITGESAAFERVGATKDAPNLITNRHGDTPLDNTPHSRRWVFTQDYDVADLIDRQDRVKLLIQPDSIYTIKHAGVMGRGIDDSIILAMTGNAVQGQGNVLGSATSTVALPAAQKVVSGAVGMTIAKLRDAKRILDQAEVDEFIPRWIVMSAQQFDDLLGTTEVTSADFNTVKALVRGDLDTFMGFQFLRSERLPKPSTDRLCYAWAQTGVIFGSSQMPVSVAAPRPDKRMSQQIYTHGTWGAVRVEDEMVVEIAAAE